jgi:dTDP-glucose 4,6-dehydratase
MKKTYLITGGAGFIGSNFIHYLLNKYEEIQIVNVDKLTYAGNLENLKDVIEDPRHTFIQADICNKDDMKLLFTQYAVDYVVNFAAESHVDRSISDPDVFVRTNVIGTLNLLALAREAWQIGDDQYRTGVKFQQVSTDEVYGSLGSEGLFTESTPLDPHSPYSASKASADLFVKAYYDTYQLPITITRCSNNYGPYQFPEKLIPLMINNCLTKKSLPVYGDGMQIRDWLYVEDHCKAIDLVLTNGRLGEVYNVGGHNEQPNIAIVQHIIAYLSQKVDATIDERLITHVTDRKGHDRRYGIDPSKISGELGWEPTTAFPEGIRKTIDWYLENKQWMEHVTSGAYQMYYEQMYGKR